MTLEYLKDAPPRIFDVHVHYPWRSSQAGNLSPEMQAEMLAYTCGRLNIRKVCLLGRRGDETWQVTLDAARRFPELIVSLAQVSLDEDGPEVIEDLHQRGFRGLKVTMPSLDYDDQSYYPIYECAERLGLPMLFHTGVRGGPIDYLLFHPRDPSLAEALSAGHEQDSVGSTRGAARMQPIFLDTVALAFPRLRIIGAHMGYGLYDSAAAVARWRRNVSFDISGGRVVRRHIVDRRMIYHEVLPEKLLFGSDCDVAHMSREVAGWMDAFEELGLSPDDQDKIFYRNAAAIFGEEPMSR
jgi:predicted TIM-barrel fold metal-dependent hydrolase